MKTNKINFLFFLFLQTVYFNMEQKIDPSLLIECLLLYLGLFCFVLSQ